MKIAARPLALLPLLAVFALAACDSSTPESEPAPDVAEPATPAPAAPGATPAAPDGVRDTAAADEIPSAMQGRWGLVGPDCEPGRADAKGLLTIGPKRLEFYESVGTLRDIADRSGTSIRAVYDFTGEGMNWERDQLLELQDGGETLVRREYGQDAAPEPLRYSKCA